MHRATSEAARPGWSGCPPVVGFGGATLGFGRALNLQVGLMDGLGTDGGGTGGWETTVAIGWMWMGGDRRDCKVGWLGGGGVLGGGGSGRTRGGR